MGAWDLSGVSKNMPGPTGHGIRSLKKLWGHARCGSPSQKTYLARQDMGFGFSKNNILGPTGHVIRCVKQNMSGPTGHGIRCLKKHVGPDKTRDSLSQRTCWSRQDMGFGVSKKHVGPERTWDLVSQETCWVGHFVVVSETVSGSFEDGFGIVLIIVGSF